MLFRRRIIRAKQMNEWAEWLWQNDGQRAAVRVGFLKCTVCSRKIKKERIIVIIIIHKATRVGPIFPAGDK